MVRGVVGIAAAIALLAGACIAVLLSGPEQGSAAPSLPALLEIEQGGLRYTFHLPTGEAALFDLDSAPGASRNLAAERPGDVDRLRALLSEQHGVTDVESLRVRYRESTEALRRLGYL